MRARRYLTGETLTGGWHPRSDVCRARPWHYYLGNENGRAERIQINPLAELDQAVLDSHLGPSQAAVRQSNSREHHRDPALCGCRTPSAPIPFFSRPHHKRRYGASGGP